MGAPVLSPRILIMGPNWVGDMVLAHSLFQIIKQQHPGALIDVAAPAWTLPLLERMPEVANAIALPFKHGELNLGARMRLGRSLRPQAYTQVILLTNSLKLRHSAFCRKNPQTYRFHRRAALWFVERYPQTRQNVIATYR